MGTTFATGIHTSENAYVFGIKSRITIVTDELLIKNSIYEKLRNKGSLIHFKEMPGKTMFFDLKVVL